VQIGYWDNFTDRDRSSPSDRADCSTRGRGGDGRYGDDGRNDGHAGRLADFADLGGYHRLDRIGVALTRWIVGKRSGVRRSIHARVFVKPKEHVDRTVRID
jgi:hypothetical protein